VDAAEALDEVSVTNPLLRVPFVASRVRRSFAASLCWPKLFDLCRSGKQYPSIELVTRQRDAICGPLADNGERPGRRQWPDPPIPIPTATSATAPAVHENRLAGIRVTLKRVPGIPEIRRLTAISEFKPEAKKPGIEFRRLLASVVQ
jgi:hypothetical protein